MDKVQEIIIEEMFSEELIKPDYSKKLATRIRRQIGHELLEDHSPDDDWKTSRVWLFNRIREICK